MKKPEIKSPQGFNTHTFNGEAMMNNSKNRCNRQPVCLPTVLLALALFAGSASVGHADELSSMVITAERPAHTSFSSSIRNEMRADTETAVWMTRINVGTDLGMKLSQPNRSFRVAALDMNKRG